MAQIVTKKALIYLILIAIITIYHVAHAQAIRQQVRIVGSSTIYPFAAIVAEQLGKTTTFRTPIVESTGSGSGFKLFCSGVGLEYPDVTNSSRRITRDEFNSCVSRGITDIVEIEIGYDGIVLAHAKSDQIINLTRTEIFLALAKKIPRDGQLIDNPYKTWQDISADLPDTQIEILGPPLTSGTRDILVDLIMNRSCKQFQEFLDLQEKDVKQFQTACQTIRRDGVFLETGENNNLLVQKLVANSTAIGIIGLNFLDQNTDYLQGVSIDGILPTADTISGGLYPITRLLYIYIKKAHTAIIPGLKAYTIEFTSEKALGLDGYLIDKGLIPLPIIKQELMRQRARQMINLDLEENIE